MINFEIRNTFFHPRAWLFHRYITRLHIFSLYRVEIQFIKFKIQFLENMNQARFEPWPLESITFAHMTGKLDHVREQCHSSCRSWFQDAGDVTCKIWLTLLFVTWKFSLFLFGSFLKIPLGYYCIRIGLKIPGHIGKNIFRTNLSPPIQIFDPKFIYCMNLKINVAAVFTNFYKTHWISVFSANWKITVFKHHQLNIKSYIFQTMSDGK